MTRIAFPGLGIDWFEIDPTAFTVFGINIQWYGIILSTGIVLAFLLFYYLAVKKESIIPDTVYNITLLVVPIAIVGARFTYVATRWEHFKSKGFLEMINIRGGGIAIYGAILFGLATVLIYNKIKKTSSLSMLDALAPAVMLGQTIGRWGNFVNGEAYGWTEGVENLPWRMQLDKVFIDDVYHPELEFVHPTFFYESLWNFLGLALIVFVIYRKKRFDGQVFFCYMGWYGLGRALIEMLRTDSLYLFESVLGQTLKFSVFVGFACLAAAVVGLFVLSKKNKQEKQELSEYRSVYESVKLAVASEEDALDQSVFETESDSSENGSEAETDELASAEEDDKSDSYDASLPPESDPQEESEVLAEQDLLDGEPEDAQEEKK